MQEDLTSSTCAMTPVPTSQGAGATRRAQCLGTTAIALSLALRPGTFWKVPCPAIVCIPLCSALDSAVEAFVSARLNAGQAPAVPFCA